MSHVCLFLPFPSVFHFAATFSCLMSLRDFNFDMFTSCRPISDVSSDLTIEVGAASFALHKVYESIFQ